MRDFSGQSIIQWAPRSMELKAETNPNPTPWSPDVLSKVWVGGNGRTVLTEGVGGPSGESSLDTGCPLGPC